MRLPFLITLAMMLLTGASPAVAQEIPASEEEAEGSEPSSKLTVTPVAPLKPPKEDSGKKMQDEAQPEYNTVILQGLNKVTGHISRFDGPTGIVQRFGNLEIIPRRCWKSPPEERPENAALMEIRELQPGEDSKRIFLGWMFSSSPGLSGLEHAVYDISMVACEYRADPEKKERVVEKKAEKKVEKKEPVAKKEGKTGKKSSGTKAKKPPTP